MQALLSIVEHQQGTIISNELVFVAAGKWKICFLHHQPLMLVSGFVAEF